MRPEEVKDQIFKSYIRFRKGLAVLAFLFPIGLLVIGLWYGIPPRDSMSAYYFAQMPGESTQYVFPMRAWFVGILWAIGVFLYLYKGFSVTENRFLNIAGLAAICVAMFPMHVPEECTSCGSSAWAWAHLTAAGTLFLCMSIVAWACTDETLATLPDAVREKYRRRYTSLAAAMTVAPVAVYFVIWTMWIGQKTHPGLFWAEMTGVVVFALYWGLKSYELDTLKTQEMKLSGTGLPGSEAARGGKPTGEDLAAPKTFWGKLNKTADAARHRTGRMLEFNKLPGT